MAGIPTSAAAGEPDPVYAAIQRHKVLSAEYTVAVDRWADKERDDPDYFECLDNNECATDALFKQIDALFAIRPTTIGGAAALLRYIAQLEDWQMPPGLEDSEPMKAVQTLCASVAAALEQNGAAA